MDMVKGQVSADEFELGKKHDVANRFGAGQHHDEAVDTDADATCRRHPVLEGEKKFFVDVLNLFACLLSKAAALDVRIVEFGVTRRDLLTVDYQLIDIEIESSSRFCLARGTNSFGTWVT